jgi:hypothetical protein
MTFWCGSGSGSKDPCIWLMDPDADPDPAIFMNDLQDSNKKTIKKLFFCIILFEGTVTKFFKDKKSKRSHKIVEIIEIKVFSYYFCWIIEVSGSIPLTNGSGSGSRRLKNMWIRSIRIRIRIRNTDFKGARVWDFRLLGFSWFLYHNAYLCRWLWGQSINWLF